MSYSRLRCHLCSADYGQEARFLEHLTNAHSITDHELLYIELILNGVKPLCGCGCGRPSIWKGWKQGYNAKFLRGHNAVLDSGFANSDQQRRMVEKRNDGYKTGRLEVWNKGEDAESNESVARIATSNAATMARKKADGTFVTWQDLDPEKALAAAKKSSETKLAGFASGRLHNWTEGETAESHPSIASAAEKNSQNYKTKGRAMGRRIKLPEFLARVAKFADRLVLLSDPNLPARHHFDRLDFRCTTCSAIQPMTLSMLESSPICRTCNPKESNDQLEIVNFIRSLGFSDVITSDRTVIAPLELDAYVPSKQLAIEYNGLYWHSEKRQCDKDYHSKKHAMAAAKGVVLLQVFEDEWRDKQAIVKSMLRSRLGVCSQSIGARECEIVELEQAERREFFAKNHIAGDIPAKIAWGLRDQAGALVAALTLRRPFHKKHADAIEVARFATLADCSVPGALGRLVAQASSWMRESGYKSMLTYVDLRLGTGSSYEQVGFVELDRTPPRFWWTDFDQRYDRFAFRADKARNLTEAQIAAEAGVHRVWGCPNRVMALSA